MLMSLIFEGSLTRLSYLVTLMSLDVHGSLKSRIVLLSLMNLNFQGSQTKLQFLATLMSLEVLERTKHNFLTTLMSLYFQGSQTKLQFLVTLMSLEVQESLTRFLATLTILEFWVIVKSLEFLVYLIN